MHNLQDLQNYHCIEVRYLGATNHSPHRIKLISHRFGSSRIIPFSNHYNSGVTQAAEFLNAQGFKMIGKGNLGNSDILITSTFMDLPKSKQ